MKNTNTKSTVLFPNIPASVGFEIMPKIPVLVQTYGKLAVVKHIKDSFLGISLKESRDFVNHCLTGELPKEI